MKFPSTSDVKYFVFYLAITALYAISMLSIPTEHLITKRLFVTFLYLSGYYSAYSLIEANKIKDKEKVRV